MTDRIISLAELAEHKTSDSVWTAIDGKVYDVTPFLDDHPGGEEVLRDKAGEDSSVGYHDTGHSDEANKMLVKYLVGSLSAEDAAELKKNEVASAPKPKPKPTTTEPVQSQAWVFLVIFALIAIAYRFYFVK